MKLYSKIFGVFIGLVSFISMLYFALVPLAFNHDFYYKQFKQYKSYEEALVSEEELRLVINKVIDYLKDKESDIQITITLDDGTTKEAFTQREIDHMVDVKNLFLIGQKIAIAAIILSVISIIFLFIKRELFHIKTTKYIKYIIFGIIAFAGLVALYVLIDFDGFFDLFHEILFTNDLWLLDEDSMLIIMFREELFIILIIEILLLFFVYLLAYLLVLNNYEKKQKAFNLIYNDLEIYHQTKGVF